MPNSELEDQPEIGVVRPRASPGPLNTFYRAKRPKNWPYRTYEAIVEICSWTGHPVCAVCAVTALPDDRWETAFSWNAKTEAEGGIFSRWRCHDTRGDAIRALHLHYGVMLNDVVIQTDETRER